MMAFPSVKPSFTPVSGSSALAVIISGDPPIGPVSTAVPTHISVVPSTSKIAISSPATRPLPSRVAAVITKVMGCQGLLDHTVVKCCAFTVLKVERNTARMAVIKNNLFIFFGFVC